MKKRDPIKQAKRQKIATKRALYEKARRKQYKAGGSTGPTPSTDTP